MNRGDKVEYIDTVIALTLHKTFLNLSINLSPEIMEHIFKSLVLKVQSVLRTPSIIREIGKLLVIDSTTMSMSLGQSPWANFRKTKAGIKLHLKVVVTKDITSPKPSSYQLNMRIAHR